MVILYLSPKPFPKAPVEQLVAWAQARLLLSFYEGKTRLCELSTLPHMTPLVGTVDCTATPGSTFPEAAVRNCFLALGVKLEKKKSFHPSEVKKKQISMNLKVGSYQTPNLPAP